MSSISLSLSNLPAYLPREINEKPQVADNQSLPGKRFKAIKNASGRTWYSIIASLFYKIIEGCCWILQLKNAKHKYACLASYHFSRAISSASIIKMFGNKLINFGVNSPGPLDESYPADKNPYTKLKMMYGSQFEEWYQKVSSGEIPVDNSKLEVPRKGMCLGISMDFISRYKKALKTSANALQAIQSASQHFTDKGTIEAQITQILYHAQHTNFHKEAKQEFRLKQGEIINQGKSLVNQCKKLIVEEAEIKAKKDLSPEEILAKNKMKEELENLKKGYQMLKTKKKELKKSNFDNNCKFILKQFKPLAANLDFDISLAKSMHHRKANGKNQEVMHPFLQSLKPGIYLVANYNHATAYIKVSDEESYLHDPNYGTASLSVEEAAKHIKLEDDKKEDADQVLRFFECT